MGNFYTQAILGQRLLIILGCVTEVYREYYSLTTEAKDIERRKQLFALYVYYKQQLALLVDATRTTQYSYSIRDAIVIPETIQGYELYKKFGGDSVD